MACAPWFASPGIRIIQEYLLALAAILASEDFWQIALLRSPQNV